MPSHQRGGGGGVDSVFYTFLPSPFFFQESADADTLLRLQNARVTSHRARNTTAGRDATRRRDESIILSHYAGENCVAPSHPTRDLGPLEEVQRCVNTNSAGQVLFFVFFVELRRLGGPWGRGEVWGRFGCECDLFVVPLHYMRRTLHDPVRIN